MTAPEPHAMSGAAPEPAGVSGSWLERAARISDLRLTLLVGAALFGLYAWPLLLVPVPPLQDLPNHLATAHIVAHPDLFPEFAFNGLFKSNALLTLWFYTVGRLGLYGAARAFVALVLAANALALPMFVLRFAGRRALPVAMLFAWPLVHGFAVSMGFLNFAFAFALALMLLTVLDRQREAPTIGRGVAIGLLAGAVWYAHPFPLAVVGALVALHVATRATMRERVASAVRLLLPLAPAGALALLAAQHHLVKSEHSTAASAAFLYLNPWENLEHLWLDVSGALTRWGAATAVPAILLPILALASPSRQPRPPRAFFSAAALVCLGLAYAGLPTMMSNWNYLNCRLAPFLWLALLVRLPERLPRPLVALLALSGLSFSLALGVDYVRLDRDRAEFTAGMDAVPPRATLLSLVFNRSKTSHWVASLTHAWGYYTVEKDASAPLIFGVERTYPITYRDFPPSKLIPPALDRFAERNGTPADVCRRLGQPPDDATCVAAWRDIWRGFWREAEPRFSHLLTWAMPAEARALVPPRYHRVYAAEELEIYARDGSRN
ncbi:MAG TPA: hypothetical protein VKZ18_28270 [Polyangia bacterium]|nr:hypothetical protein [Polyangia bacterium]